MKAPICHGARAPEAADWPCACTCACRGWGRGWAASSEVLRRGAGCHVHPRALPPGAAHHTAVCGGAGEGDWPPPPSPAEVVRRVNELIATGQYGRLFAVVHFASRQWKVTSEDLILIGNELDLACGERIRLEKVRPPSFSGYSGAQPPSVQSPHPSSH